MLGGSGGGGGGAGLGLDLSAVIQAAVLGLVLFSAAVVAIRRAASRYFVVDAAGFAASYDDHHHHSSAAYPMPSQGKQEPGPAGEEAGPCAKCGGVSSKKCSGCKRVRYCSQECQTKHWQTDHKFKCKQMKLLDPGDKLSSEGDANSKKSTGFGRISLVPARKKLNKVIFPYDGFLKLYNWRDLDFLPCGLMNCGNSCFANVVLQCLSCTRPLVAYLLGKDHSRECSMRHEDWCFLCELQCHIQRASESLHPFAPMNILSHLPNIGGNLGFGRQEDAHEFMRFAIDKMQSACLDEYGGEKAVDLSTQETTVIQHIFGGRLQSQVQCTACGMVSNRYDNMMDLTVEIQGDAESLEKCLDQFTAVEWLDGDNKYKCDGCNDYVKARKHLSVHQAPNILTITLKRFQSGRFGKLNKRVTFPMELDLTPYMSSTDGSDLYDLYAVVVHLDMLNASFFGHYICYIKGCRGSWYKIDDCKVMIVDEEEVHAQGAYMLLYSRRTARPRPLITVEELMKQQQCKAVPSNGQNHLIPEDATLNCESPSKSSEDLLQQDSESNNESLHKMDIKDLESDLDLHISNEGNKLISNENLHLPGSPVSHVLEDTRTPGSPLEGSTSMRSVQFGPPLEGVPTTMSSVQFGSTSEASSVHSFAEQCEESASCIDSVDYMDIEAGAEVERRNEQRPILNDSGKTDNKASVPTFVNGMTRKPKPLFSPGFLDKPSRKRSSFAEEGHIGGCSAGSSQKLNGHCNGHLINSEQGVLANSCGSNLSFGSEKCNGDMFATSNNGNYHAVNGDIQSKNGSLHADKRDMPFVSHGFKPRPYREPSGSNSTSSGKPSKACQGDMSLLHWNFLERPCSRGKSVKVDDCLPFSNGTSSSFVNGNSKSRHCRESAVISTSPSSMHGLETSSNISMEQKSNGAAVVPDHVEEKWSSDCTTNGSSFQLRSASDDKTSDYLGENGHAILATKNTSCGQENGSNGTPDGNGVGCQRDGAPALLVSKKILGSEHDGLRRRVTSNFFEQNGIDGQ
ncbi:ubiquitin carboxyl-terminal hydrolase 19-like [Phragmites australis]|uniref:ubiquitin carboxyl-terminal hydrolase 19-like n=1 Tax=Phragmites australis TaxID=29695 RepID=UPI002D79CF22|nr:ubiquitin carboxyl-terminal hydrolase 19-like [Phragmites australis]